MSDPLQEGGLAELREIIAGPLRARLDDPVRQARDISSVLPEALALRSRDPAISKALAPAVEDAMTTSVRANPKALSDALFPVMGPAIRKSLAHALEGMLESLNRALDRSLSIESLGWRWQAMRTHKPFSEIVLLNTVLFRVEQVFLIHRETALLLHHVASGDAVLKDADMMSGMLSAIRDFVADSLTAGSGGASGESVDSLQIGELNVWIVPGPRALLAVVIRGSAPREFRATLEETIEDIHLRFGTQLESFNGDAAAFVAAEPYLEACLRQEYREKQKKTSPVLRTALLAGAVLLVWGGILWYRESSRWNDYIHLLAGEPGVIVVSAERGWWRHTVTGLRDPLAADPQELLSQSGLNPDRVTSRWEPYQALAPKFILARAKILLQPPPGVTLSLQNGVVYAKGAFDPRWLADNSRLATALGGVSALRSGESLEAAMARLKPEIEGARIRFPSNASEPSAEESAKLQYVEAQLREVASSALSAGASLRVDVLGYADASGDSAFNRQLSQTRADKISARLRNAAIPGAVISPAGLGSGTAAGPGKRKGVAEDRQVMIRISVAGR